MVAQSKLLVVDDEPSLQDIVATSMRFLGYDVSVASSGREAVRAATDLRPDLIILDIMLPDFDGLEVMRRLRAECAWKREQTHRSLARYLLEETHETLEAIDAGAASGDWAHLEEELGDLLFQVVFHARIAEENGDFAFRDVVQAICDKMIRRHPHVFAGESYGSLEAQVEGWEAIKAGERAAKALKHAGDGGGVLGDVPAGLPALARAVKLTQRAGRVGFDWPDAAAVIDKLLNWRFAEENLG